MKDRIVKTSIRPMTFLQACQPRETWPKEEERWLVVADLPPKFLPWTVAYLRKTGEWTFAACHSGPDEPDSAYFLTEGDAVAASAYSKSVIEQLGISIMGDGPKRRPWWKFWAERFKP